MTRWKRKVKRKLAAQLAPMYAKIRHSGHVGEIIIPADGDSCERYLYCAYQFDTVYDDMYGGSHVLKRGGYVSCYYVEGDDEYGAAYVEVATNLKQAIGYLLQSYSISQLLGLRLGSVDDVGSYICG